MPEVLVMLFTAVAWVLILIGCVFVFAGGVGLFRLPDLYTRLHAAGVTVTDTGSTIFMILGMMIIAAVQYQNPWIVAKLMLILFFTLFTTPTSSHALAKTALLSGHVPTDEHGDPILDSPETAQKVARSRIQEDGRKTLAPGVGEADGDVSEHDHVDGDPS